MKAVGITAEYNPFHLGHAYQITETRRRIGEDRPVICVMSGNWVQRGECALTDKWTRAELALRNGADLILELPLPWAISSAEGFSRGAITTLLATGLVDTISFGSESGNIEALRRLAHAANTPTYWECLHYNLDFGLPFAQARQKAMSACVGTDAQLLRGPNDNLGVEYLRTAGDSCAAVAIIRQGVHHDSTSAADGYASATLLRALAREDRWEELARWTPEGTADILRVAGIADMSYLERAILARLRFMKEENFAALPDSGRAEGLTVRLYRAAQQADSLEQFCQMVKTKRYAYARIRRLILCAFLGLGHEKKPTEPRYIRVLGMNSRGKQLLKEMKNTADLPVITKAAHIRRLDAEAQNLFELESCATDLYALCFPNVRSCGMDYKKGPVIL